MSALEQFGKILLLLKQSKFVQTNTYIAILSAESLLLNILPREIAQRFKRSKAAIVEEFATATIFFSDIVGFTQMSASKSPDQLVSSLNDLFSKIDRIVQKNNVEKIKTIGKAHRSQRQSTSQRERRGERDEAE